MIIKMNDKGFNKITQEQFSFLQSDYNFNLTQVKKLQK